MKHNAATNQIVVFVKVDETFTMIWLSRSSEVRVKVMRWPQSPLGLFLNVYIQFKLWNRECAKARCVLRAGGATGRVCSAALPCFNWQKPLSHFALPCDTVSNRNIHEAHAVITKQAVFYHSAPVEYHDVLVCFCLCAPVIYSLVVIERTPFVWDYPGEPVPER